MADSGEYDPGMPSNRPPGRRSGLAVFLLAALAAVIGYYVAQNVQVWLRGSKDVEREFPVMNTAARIVIPSGSGSHLPPERLADMAEKAIREVNDLMGPFGEKSDVRRLNQSRAGEWIEVNPLTWQVVMEALRWHRLTGGAFDPTIGPVKRLFKFDRKMLERWPDTDELERAKNLIGGDKLLFEREGMRLAWRQDGMYLDLGAIAKGFSVDRAAEVLMANGVRNALIEVGGEVRLLGKRPGNPPAPWKTGVRNPRGNKIVQVLETSDMAIATSGDYENYFMYQGKRYEHIIDPRTGLPLAEGVASVTVMHPTSCAAADALATSLCVLGQAGAADFLRSQALGLFRDGVDVVMYIVGEDGVVHGRRMSVSKDGVFTESDK